MSIGKSIKDIRMERSWTQCDLAEHSGVSQTHISAIENGNKKSPGIETVKKIADAFGITVDELIKQSQGE